MASIYRVSRTVVRSALQALAHDRLARLEPNRGAFVAQPSKVEAREIFEARTLIEPRVAALAARLRPTTRHRALRQHLEEEHEALQTAGTATPSCIVGALPCRGIAEIAEHSTFTGYRARTRLAIIR